ncbi:CerR family C-terminal domain-containing protein [Dyella caseinilytica]|uniref:CerR family C-terminal domain-containing protein n=1 Tax=Dyella caseinilytica TaxID=1849581 RepID=A0ABX7GZU6_9GAMM|nr:CerR family C-terminal domain-containing protein [Dyella caseinilytica]QRN55344.1 CerR family C-terminal domain-containing protein [Dyella caseinilytica]GGA01050.1 transcriptional regulator [Dyella caseinilytica]
MTQAKRLRRPSAGGYARGDETRQRIIDAAIQLFGEHGFERASTRDIASAAGVNAPALQYYFESKEGLYKACAEYITDDLKARYAPVMKQIRDALKNNADVNILIDAYLRIQALTLDSVLVQPHLSKGRLVGRELAGESPNVASEMLQKKMKRPINKLMLSLLANIMHTRPGDTITRIRLLTLKGLVLAFYYPPGACLDLLEWKEIDAAKAVMIKAAVHEQTRTLLMSWHDAGKHKAS